MKTPFPSILPATAAQDRITLCLACGFCCNGVLHTYTRVAANEVPALQRLGTPIYPIPDGTNHRDEFAFDQPCPHWQGNCCAIYAQRPKSCRGYECLLYKKLAAGLISPAGSLARLQKTQQLLAQLLQPATVSDQARLNARLRASLRRHFEPDTLTYS
jgi:hypothetical protein